MPGHAFAIIQIRIEGTSLSTSRFLQLRTFVGPERYPLPGSLPALARSQRRLTRQFDQPVKNPPTSPCRDPSTFYSPSNPYGACMVRRRPLGTRPGIFTTHPEKVAPRHPHTRCPPYPLRISPHLAGYGASRCIHDVSTAFKFLLALTFMDTSRVLAVALPPFLPLSVHVLLMFSFLFCKPLSCSFLLSSLISIW